MAAPGTLAIVHEEGSSPAAFKLTRLPDGKSAAPVAIASPYDFPVARQSKKLMEELRWYLEQFLDYPFSPETEHADRVLDALKAWGTEAFDTLFDRGDAADWLAHSAILQIRSDDPHILSWPWEVLFDPQANYLAHERRIERCLNKLRDAPPLNTPPTDRVNILFVVARPYKGDVRYRSIARPLVDLIQSKGLPAHVDVLRPPTFDQLREHLRAHPGYYHVLHFDGHGAYTDGAGQYSSPHQYKGHQGCLIFEDKIGDPDPKSARDLSTLLREYAVPAVVLNACQSAMLDQSAEDAFASVATALLQSGMRSVVAMAYSLYVSGAQVFLPAFYRRLFEVGSIAEAVRAGRQEMLAHKDRICARGRYPLEDWLLPVLYQQDPVDFPFATQPKGKAHESHLPKELLERSDPYGFIGRDGPILEIERALHRNAPAILVQGLGGVGKTTLARGFLRWLDETGGLDGALWFDFRDIRSAEYVINRTGEAFYGENFGIAPNKLELLAAALEKPRFLIVWDNFESAAPNLTEEDRNELGRFLDAIRGKRGKVIITSRSTEEWLGPTRRFELKLGGLDGEERWEYCETIIQDLGLKVNRNDPRLITLMDQLAGHPLAMRVVLPKLETMSASRIAQALRTNIAELGLNEQEEQGRLFATLRFVEQGLSDDLRPLLGLAGLHEGYLDGHSLELIAKEIDSGWTRQRIDRFIATLGSAGLLRDIGNAVYQMHPLLTSYLRSQKEDKTELFERAFVGFMGGFANYLVSREFHEQRIPFLRCGANFHLALSLAERLSMDREFAALMLALAEYARKSRNFEEATRLFERLAEHHAKRGNSEQQATAYHQLGLIAQEHRDFVAATERYQKCISIANAKGHVFIAANANHELGIIATHQRDFATAREYFGKSLAITEQHGQLREASFTHHQLGRVAEEQLDFASARESYLKSAAIKEKLGNIHDLVMTYHHLGMVAQYEGDLASAQEWSSKALTIADKLGIEEFKARIYHQLGNLAAVQGDFQKARGWHFKSLDIKEKQGKIHEAAITYTVLGITARSLGTFQDSGAWLIRSIRAFRQTSDQDREHQSIRELMVTYREAPPAEKQTLEALWNEANLGPFPSEPNP